MDTKTPGSNGPHGRLTSSLALANAADRRPRLWNRLAGWGILAGLAVIAAMGGCESSPLTSSEVVDLPAEQLLVVPAEAVLGIGYTVQLQATPMTMAGDSVPGYEIAWTSTDDAIASVSSDGTVTALSFGTVTITATAEKKPGKGHGKENAPGQLKKNAKIVVDTTQVASVEVTPPASDIVVGVAVQHSATARDSAGNVLTGRQVVWSSSNASVATVDATGLVVGVSVGSATISATVDGETGMASVTVTTAQPPPNNRPAAPSGLDRTQTDSSIIVMWVDNADNEDGFEIERTLEADFANWQTYATTGANAQSFEDKALTADVEYCYRVRAFNTDGASDFATNPDYVCKRFLPPNPPPPPPPPGASEPIFDANLHNSLWFDDFSSYSSLGDMQAGGGAHQWGGNFGGWAFKLGATPQDNFIQADYQGTGEITREITARDDVLAGTDPQQVIMSVLIRSIGRSYQGKVTVFKTGNMPYTTMRWVPRMTSSNPMPVPGLSETYWEPDWPWDRLPGPDAIPRADSYGLALARDWGQCGVDNSWWDYKQNVSWSQLEPWAHWNDGAWHRWTVRWTKSGGKGPCGDGQGRIEWWWDGVLVFQWIGDDPTRPEYGKVFVSGAGERAIGQPYWFGPSRFNWQGGGYLELNEVRFYSVK